MKIVNSLKYFNLHFGFPTIEIKILLIMRKITLVAIIFLLNFNLIAQFKPLNLDDLENKYTDYFELNRELVFIHLNKTAVIKKENLWFSAYIYNAILNAPNSETVNLNLDIFNEVGTFLESKTVLIVGGKGSAYLDLNKNFYSEGKYFIKASTDYMKNFKEDLSYVQYFHILGAVGDNKTDTKVDLDLQLLPEGGHILTEVWNNIGVKLIDSNGNSVIFGEGKLLNSKNEIISTFKSNQFGLSKFNYLPDSEQSYSVEITTLNGDKIKQTLPKAELRGFNVSGNNLKEQIIFKVSTNSNSRNLIKNKTFYAAVHQDGNIKDLSFQFPEDKLEVTLSLSKDTLFSGINTVTIFDENFNPLLERLFFNANKIRRVRLNAEIKGAVRDSVIIGLKSTTPINNNSLSISVLPEGTKSYMPNHNILSAFYLKPYLKGDLENGSYYFSESDTRKIDYDVDLLMLTQGWGKFDWSSIYNTTPKLLVEHERGFTINGKINNRNEKKENQILIKSEETGLFEIVEIQEDDTFIVKNVYLLDSSLVSYSLINDKNSKIYKPSIYTNILPVRSHSNLNTDYSYLNFKSVQQGISDFEEFILDAEILDTVNLKGYRSKLEIPRWELRVNDKYVEVTDELAQRYLYVTDYIAQNGFLVYYDDFNEFYIKNRLPFSLGGELLSPLIYFNGFPNGTPRQLEYLYMHDLESIVINKLGLGYGGRGGGGVIKIQTRTKPRGQIFRETVREIITTNGFTKEKEFYAPKYTSYLNDGFKNYGVIDWISDISIKQNGIASFKVLNTMQPKISLFIEGITVDGKLISEVIEVQTR